jgi:hypothetical protein
VRKDDENIKLGRDEYLGYEYLRIAPSLHSFMREEMETLSSKLAMMMRCVAYLCCRASLHTIVSGTSLYLYQRRIWSISIHITTEPSNSINTFKQASFHHGNGFLDRLYRRGLRRPFHASARPSI